MHPIFYYIIIFLVLGGIGMAISNRKAAPAVRRQRWLKYFMYIFITGTVIISIFYHVFYILACLLVAAGAAELYKVNLGSHLNRSTIIKSVVIFLLIAAGFLLFARNFNEPFLLFIYFQVLVFDGFCQVSGQLFGKHPLVPKISPTKTWEGLIGGWLCCIIAAWLASGWLIDFPGKELFGLVCGILTGLVAFYGDLLASFYKRKTGVKDYSNWLPGQGGFLDRFDSFLVTGAIYYLLFVIIFKEGPGGFIK